jgi:hypothetical protein
VAAFYVSEIPDEIKKIGEFCYNPFSFFLDLVNSRIIATEGNESLVFESGKKKDIKIIGNFKPIDFSDPNSSFDFVRDFQKAASEYNESINKINELIESLSETLSISLPAISETRKVNLVNSGDELSEPIQNPDM